MEFNLKGMQLTELTENEMRNIDGGKGGFKKFWKGLTKYPAFTFIAGVVIGAALVP